MNEDSQLFFFVKNNKITSTIVFHEQYNNFVVVVCSRRSNSKLCLRWKHYLRTTSINNGHRQQSGDTNRTPLREKDSA